MATLTEGAKAPAFSLPDQDGKKVSLSSFRGKPVVLYFYPKDDTPGCTTEACAFRDAKQALAREGAVVLGVSKDDRKSHRKFTDKFELNFPLLSDEDHHVAEAYGAWGERSLYGRKFMGMIRSTFLIDGAGKIAKVWPKVKVTGHDEEVLAALESLRTGEPAKKPASKKAPAKKAPAKKAPAAKAKPARGRA